MTLYLKYRPQTIDELDLESVRETLTSIFSSDEAPHAFLFAGPRGAGKTSAARIVAKVLNCENLKGITPCNKCSHCLSINRSQHVDVIEMDAASNRGIDDVRALKEGVSLMPQLGGKKVYIIDEAHMLTPEASNALLKTLEEPPEHVMFIFATTDPQKLPPTIRSRLSPVQFTKATEKEILRQLKRVAEGEKMTIDGQALSLIARSSDGSFRDAVKGLERLNMGNRGKRVTVDMARKELYSSAGPSEELAALIEKGDTVKALGVVESAISQGMDAGELLAGVLGIFRKKLLRAVEEGGGVEKIMEAVEALMDASGKPVIPGLEQIPLELAIVGYCGSPKPDTKGEQALRPMTNGQKKVKKKGNKGLGESVWNEILSRVRGHNTKMEALLHVARPLEFDGRTLNIGVYYRFHKERLENTEMSKELESIVRPILGNCRVSYTLTEPPEPLTQAGDLDIISAAKEIFGG